MHSPPPGAYAAPTSYRLKTRRKALPEESAYNCPRDVPSARNTKAPVAWTLQGGSASKRMRAAATVQTLVPPELLDLFKT